MFKVFGLLPIFILIAIMPLVFYLDSVPASVSGNAYYSTPFDFFNATKSKWITTLAPFSLICSFFSKYSNKNNVKRLIKEPVFYSILIYFLLVILSTVFSSFKDVAIYGINERFEGMISLLCYFCFWLAIFIQVRETLQIKFLLGCFYFYLLISFIIGFSQFIDKNILLSEFMKPFIASSDLSYLLEDLDFNSIPHYIFLTLNNQNYVGTMMSMATTICFSAYTVTTKIKFKIFHGFFACTSFFLLIGSTSRGGYIAAFVGIFFIAVALYKKILHNWKSTIVVFFRICGCIPYNERILK